MPDIYVELDEDDEPIITMSGANSPGLRINRMYNRMSRDRDTDRPAKEFLQKNIRSANWLIGAIRQRRETVRRVAIEVFRVQKDFFEHGKTALRSLPMATVADRVGVHVATVSRAVAGKYVQTPRGIYPLRMFFTGGTTTDAGADMAWDAVKAKLRQIVADEDKVKPCNDDELVAELASSGITIARRTVAKYRKLMNIPPARQRREY
jgi:RNA polymerase sigma-54 factor